MNGYGTTVGRIEKQKLMIKSKHAIEQEKVINFPLKENIVIGQNGSKKKKIE